MIKISHSDIKDYLSCPKLFYYRRYLKIELPYKPMPLTFGSCLHSALEWYEKKGSDPIKLFKKLFTEDKIEDDDMIRYYDEHENGIRLLEHFLEEREDGILSEYEVEQTEKRFYTRIRKLKVRSKIKYLSGIVDMIQTDEALVDYKTSSKPYKQEMIDDKRFLQPTVYYLWYYLTYGRLPPYFRYIVFLKKRKREPIQVLDTTRTMDDLISLIKTINSIASKVESKEFPRTHAGYTFCDCFRYEKFLQARKK